MKKIPKVYIKKISRGYLYTGVFFFLLLHVNQTITLADEEVFNPINPAETVNPKNPEPVKSPEVPTTSPQKNEVEKVTEKVEEETLHQENKVKKSGRRKKKIKKDEFFRPVERVALNKRAQSTAGSNNDMIVEKTKTGMMFAALSGRMVFGAGE